MEYVICLDINGLPDVNNSSKVEAANLEDALDVYVYIKMGENIINSEEQKITVWVLDDDFWEQIVMVADVLKDCEKILYLYKYLLNNN